MGLLRKNKLAEPPKIRVENVPVERKPKPVFAHRGAPSSSFPSGSSSNSKNKIFPKSSRRTGASSSRPSPYPNSPSPSASSTGGASRLDRKRKALSRGTSRPSPAAPSGSDRVDFGRDSDSEDEDGPDSLAELEARRRAKRGRVSDEDRLADPDRVLKNSRAFDADAPPVEFIHAAEVAWLKHPKCEPVLGAKQDEVAIELQYPSLQPRERFELVHGKDMIDAVHSIISVVRHVADTYLTDSEAAPFVDHSNGLVRRLEKASSSKVNDLAAFRRATDEFNDKVLALVRDGTIPRNLDDDDNDDDDVLPLFPGRRLPRSLVDFVLDQVYDRTVAPRVELLAKYENGTDNVYGELLHPFVSKMLVDRLGMTSSMTFVDLGSGVANVVVQAALEVGCESWGCEMMENACNLAEAQEKEFRARCALWGLEPGKVRLERGDFRKNEAILGALKRADVVLVNNQAFTSQLNDDLVRMFLDLKSGCKIVSLKTFVHDHKTTSNDLGRTILDVEQLTYPQGYVSWTNAGGTYCISTRK